MAFPHEVIVELFRNRPELARELLQLCAGIQIRGGIAQLASIDLTQVASTEFRADAVTVIRDTVGVAVSAVIVEVQRDREADKRLTWPVYVTTLRAKLECPVTLLVVVQDEALGRWARKPIDIGHPGFCLQPIVVTYAEVPRLTDPDLAVRSPELAVLSAIAHEPNPEMAPALASALRQFSGDNRELYSQVIVAAWPMAPRTWLEELMLKPEVRAEIDRLAYAIGVEKGIEKGIEKGRIDTLRTVATNLARAKLEAITHDDERRIQALADEALLTQLVDALGLAHTAHDARAALDMLALDRA